jgi:tetratricopeptide (TPR) repeat protein
VSGVRAAVLAAVAAGCLAAAIGLQVGRDRRYAIQQQHVERILYVRSGSAIERLVLDFDALAADVYWIRAIQHYGGDRLSRTAERKYELLYPLLDHATTLDPYFTIAYRFGAVFLSEPYPGGPGAHKDAIALLQKGIAAQPQKWHYYHDIAFVYYWRLDDFQSAAQWFQRAAEQPQAPNWLPVMAAAMLTSGDDRRAARFLWQQILQSDQDWLRRNAERSLLQLDALDAMDQLRVVARRFPPPTGEPHSWEWLVRRGVLRGIPTDPTGVPFDIDPVTGEPSVSSTSALHPMPDRLRRQR